MSPALHSSFSSPARVLSEVLFHEVTSLLIMSHLITRSLLAVRPECAFSRELTGTLDRIMRVSSEGETYLYRPLIDAGAVMPAAADASALALVTSLFTRLPTTSTPRVLATELSVNLRLLAQHVELKARRAAEEAERLGEHALGHALQAWATEWRACGQIVHTATARTRSEAQAAEFGGFAVPLGA